MQIPRILLTCTWALNGTFFLFFCGVDVGMKCQQPTFVVSSCDGTCFFFFVGWMLE